MQSNINLRFLPIVRAGNKATERGLSFGRLGFQQNQHWTVKARRAVLVRHIPVNGVAHTYASTSRLRMKELFESAKLNLNSDDERREIPEIIARFNSYTMSF